MKIAIIDTGIDTKHRKLNLTKVSGISFRIDTKNNQLIRNNNFSDHNGHGTAVASIIHKFVPNAELVCIKIFHEGRQTHDECFIAAIDWCIQQKDIKIINMSIGISEKIPNKRLTEVSKKAHQAGIILIAACNNDVNKNAFPASYPWVFGVVSGQIKESRNHGKTAKTTTNFIAKGSIQRVAWKNREDKIVSGTSYATPHITGIIGTYLNKTPILSFNQIQRMLTTNADKNIKPLQQSVNNSHLTIPNIHNFNEKKIYESLFNSKRKFPWIKDILVFPISEKEMQAFSLFPEQCIFNIREIVDYPRIFSSLNPDIKDPKPVEKSIDIILDKVDTLILGYYQDNMWEGNICFGNELVKKAIKKQKSFFLFDKVIYNYILNETNKTKINTNVYLPKIPAETIEKIEYFQYLPNINCPVLMVIGTGNKQGKFTTQLRLKDILQKENVNITHLSTEPQGELFGAEYSFPIGHKNYMKLSTGERMHFLRTVIKMLCDYKKSDILITGSQGGLIPRHPLNNIPYYPCADSVAFIHGVLPDIIICTISPEDSIEIIENTVKTANIYTKCHTIFYALTPYVRLVTPEIVKDLGTNNYLTEEAYERKRSYFEKHLKKKVLNILDTENNNIIIKLIEDACS